MSEGKRVSLQSIGPTKKDKKSESTSTTIRLNLTLPTCDSVTFADFNYNTLILNEKVSSDVCLVILVLDFFLLRFGDAVKQAENLFMQ